MSSFVKNAMTAVAKSMTTVALMGVLVFGSTLANHGDIMWVRAMWILSLSSGLFCVIGFYSCFADAQESPFLLMDFDKRNRQASDGEIHPKFEADTCDILEHFTSDTVKALSWKKRDGFVHAYEDILAVFDESYLNLFFNLLMNCVVRISASCASLGTRIISRSSCIKSNANFDKVKKGDSGEKKIFVKRFQDLRSLCLKIIYHVLSNYKEHDFGGAFWDLFCAPVKPSIAKITREVPSSKKSSPMVCCFLAMSKSYKLVPLLSKEGDLVQHIFSSSSNGVKMTLRDTKTAFERVLERMKRSLEREGTIPRTMTCNL
ncbi:cationic amino acid transporter 1 [Phtheirospermum japonicum]|uniref:Cationic amino acid transporter 1 n=1 Tax=Phtheirospermum japonicum TaxID=374723 RepID=A0A830B221_9LAMI|nr:cationic amino acid transporter 1 [Phtheirospermum japonicum]